jgi:hypothetical protein
MPRPVVAKVWYAWGIFGLIKNLSLNPLFQRCLPSVKAPACDKNITRPNTTKSKNFTTLFIL